MYDGGTDSRARGTAVQHTTYYKCRLQQRHASGEDREVQQRHASVEDREVQQRHASVEDREVVDKCRPRNSSGSRVDPCGTPEQTERKSERT